MTVVAAALASATWVLGWLALAWVLGAMLSRKGRR